MKTETDHTEIERLRERVIWLAQYQSGLVADGCWDQLDQFARDSIDRALNYVWEAQQERIVALQNSTKGTP